MKKKSSTSKKSKSKSQPKKQTTSKKAGNGRSQGKSDSSDIVSLILRDHKPIKELLLVLKDPEITISKKQPAFYEFEQLLSSHAKAEEESLYVYLKQEDDLRVEGLEGDTEHSIADQLMEEVNDSRDDDDLWMAKVKVLAEVVDHHVKEEEKELLKEVRKDFDSSQRAEIGEVYSRLLSKYREDSRGQKKYADKDKMRAEYV